MGIFEDEKPKEQKAATDFDIWQQFKAESEVEISRRIAAKRAGLDVPAMECEPKLGSTIEISKAADEYENKAAELQNTLVEIKKYHPVPVAVRSELALPKKEEYDNFNNDLTFYKDPFFAEIKNNVLMLKSRNTTINIGLLGLTQILADKFDSKIAQNIDLNRGVEIPNYLSHFYQKQQFASDKTWAEQYAERLGMGTLDKPSFQQDNKTAHTLPDFDLIQAILNEKLFQAKTAFSNIIHFGNDDVLAACQYYTDLMSVPLILKLQFYAWERSLIYVKVKNGIDAGLLERDEQVKQIRKEYEEKCNQDEIHLHTEIDKAKRAIQKFKSMAQGYKDEYDELTDKYNELQTEHEENYKKLRDAETIKDKFESELADTKRELATVKEQLKKFTEQPWSLDPACDLSAPVFYNKVTGDVVTYPADFKSYKLQNKDGDCMVYNKDSEVFRVPEQLMLRFGALTVPAQAQEVPKKSESKLSKNKKTILGAIPRDGMPKTIMEIAEELHMKEEDVHKEIKELESMNLIEVTDDDGVVSYLAI